MEMVFLFLFFSMLFLSISPMSFSILVVTLSVLLSVAVYFSSLSLIFPVLVIFIFSSGMMVIFCYCAIMVNYEEAQKGFSKAFSILGMLLLLFVLFSSNTVPQSLGSSLESLYIVVPNFIIFVMAVIYILLKGVNILLYNPFKSLMESY